MEIIRGSAKKLTGVVHIKSCVYCVLIRNSKSAINKTESNNNNKFTEHDVF